MIVKWRDPRSIALWIMREKRCHEVKVFNNNDRPWRRTPAAARSLSAPSLVRHSGLPAPAARETGAGSLDPPASTARRGDRASTPPGRLRRAGGGPGPRSGRAGHCRLFEDPRTARQGEGVALQLGVLAAAPRPAAGRQQTSAGGEAPLPQGRQMIDWSINHFLSCSTGRFGVVRPDHSSCDHGGFLMHNQPSDPDPRVARGVS